MAITEETRHRLYQRLEGFLGPDEATILMEHLPPVGWADVATKRDLDQFAALIRAELRGELGSAIGGVRAEIGGVRAELGDVRAELGSGIGGVRAEIGDLRAEMQRDLRMQTYSLMAAFTAINGLLVGLVVGLVR